LLGETVQLALISTIPYRLCKRCDGGHILADSDRRPSLGSGSPE